MKKPDISRFDIISESARTRVYAEVMNHFKRHPDSPWSGRGLVELEKTLKAFYASVGEKYKMVFRDTLPDTMKRFYDDAVKEIRTAGQYKSIIGAPDPKRIKYFLDSSYQQVAMKTDKMLFDHVRDLRKLSADVFREVSITGATRREVSKRLLDRAMKIKGFEFIDKSGAKWPLKSYFDTLARTELMNAGRASYDDKMAEEGFDVMKLTISGNSCAKCAAFEGRLFSLTGAVPGLPSKADLEAAGVFHPNCTHSYSLMPDFIRERDYNPDGTRKKRDLQYEKPTSGAGSGTVSGGSSAPYASSVSINEKHHNAAKRAIDKINNGDEKVPRREVIYEPNPPDNETADGVFDPNTGFISIFYNCADVEKAFVEIHEISHSWDSFYNITSSSLFEPLLAAIKATKRYQKYELYNTPRNAEVMKYVFDRQELWARACSQYIAKKTNSKIIISGLENFKKRDINNMNNGQWDDEDFDGVSIEVEKLLKQLGVIK